MNLLTASNWISFVKSLLPAETDCHAILESTPLEVKVIPLPNNCFQPDECTLSYVTVLRCIKKRFKIPVPEVYYHALKSDPKNTTGTAYILMERLPGHALPTVEADNGDDGWSPDNLLSAKKVHEQLTDLIIELGER